MQQKEWATKNEALTLELNSLKQKSGDVGVVLKDVKPADPPKEDIKAVNKPDTGIKN